MLTGEEDDLYPGDPTEDKEVPLFDEHVNN